MFFKVNFQCFPNLRPRSNVSDAVETFHLIFLAFQASYYMTSEALVDVIF